jgi:hypothetical protein
VGGTVCLEATQSLRGRNDCPFEEVLQELSGLTDLKASPPFAKQAMCMCLHGHELRASVQVATPASPDQESSGSETDCGACWPERISRAVLDGCFQLEGDGPSNCANYRDSLSLTTPAFAPTTVTPRLYIS